jgi:hypothetical protein
LQCAQPKPDGVAHPEAVQPLIEPIMCCQGVDFDCACVVVFASLPLTFEK